LIHSLISFHLFFFPLTNEFPFSSHTQIVYFSLALSFYFATTNGNNASICTNIT